MSSARAWADTVKPSSEAHSAARSAPGCIAVKWNGAETLSSLNSGSTRVPPERLSSSSALCFSAACSIRLSTWRNAAGAPAITKCVWPLRSANSVSLTCAMAPSTASRGTLRTLNIQESPACVPNSCARRVAAVPISRANATTSTSAVFSSTALPLVSAAMASAAATPRLPWECPMSAVFDTSKPAS